MAKIPLSEALSYVNDSDTAVASFLNAQAKASIGKILADKSEVTLRDLHAAAVIAGMQSATRGKITVLGLEGNPGIGKTTAVKEHLKTVTDGFLFLYVSPRVIINDDVTGSFTTANHDILTLTTNSTLIGSAKTYYQQQIADDKATAQYIDSAVVVDGFKGLQSVVGSTLCVSPAEKEHLEKEHLANSNKKYPETERQDRMETVARRGVLRVLANTTRTLLNQHPTLNKIVLTAAIQGYRELSNSNSTVDALSELFKNSVNDKAGLNERRVLAERMSTIVVMVDELTGDKAGAPLVHSLTNWLTEQFIKPFAAEPLFKVILIISDASLGNELVLNTYLNSSERAPDKVLVSPSQGNMPFRLAVTPIKLGYHTLPVLHIMTNSYPANTLAIDYRVRLDVVKPAELPDGKIQTVRQAIAEQQADIILSNIVKEIQCALFEESEQVIFLLKTKSYCETFKTYYKNNNPT